MEYEEIVTAYKNGSLDISDFKKKLDIARPLKGRPKYRAVDKIGENFFVLRQVTNLLSMPRIPEKAEAFEKDLEILLNEYYTNLINSIRDVKAWKYMGLVPSEYSLEKFENLSNAQKFAIIRELMKKYYRFLDIQKIADMRDSFKADEKFTDEDVRALLFLNQMYNAFENKNIREEFFCFDKPFLMSLMNFKKSKKLRIEDYMKEKERSVKGRERKIYADYKIYSNYFSTEDYRDIIENLMLVKKTLNKPFGKIIEYYSDMSESESEQKDLIEFEEKLKDLEKRYAEMNSLKIESEKLRRIKEIEELRQKQLEESRKRAEDFEKRQRKAVEELKKVQEKAERDRIIGKTEGSTGKMEQEVISQEKKVAAREIVKPLIFFWFGKDNISLTKDIGTRKVNEFFKSLKAYEDKTGIRLSLFMVTNANQFTTQNRVKELQKKAEDYEMPRLVEGALGGYGTFKIDKNGNVIDIAKMSFENREKIKKLLERTLRFSLPTELIDETEENYLRYEFTDKKDASIDIRYLQAMAGRLLKDEKVKSQPLKFVPYIEKNRAGIDVLLASQYKGLSQLADYYKAKYHLASGKGFQVSTSSIDEFLTKTLNENGERE